MAIRTYTRQDFKTVFPTFTEWQDKILTRLNDLYDGQNPAWMNDSLTFYSQRGIYQAFLLRYKKWFHRDEEEDFLDQFAIVLGELLPTLHAKTLHLSAEGVSQLNFENIISNMKMDFLKDPDLNFIETIIDETLASKGLVKTDNTTTDATTTIRQEDNSNGGLETISGNYSTPVATKGLGYNANDQLASKSVNIVKDNAIRRESGDNTGVFDGSMDTTQDNTRNAKTKEVDKRVKVSTFTDYIKGIKDLTEMNFPGVIYHLVNDRMVVSLFLEPTPENVNGYQIWTDSGEAYTREETDALLAEKTNQSEFVQTVVGINAAVSQKANTADVYNRNEVDQKLNFKADKTSVYTKTEADTLLAQKLTQSDATNQFAQKVHTHKISEVDELTSQLAQKADLINVYTKAESNTLLANKASLTDLTNAINSHTQSIERVDGLQDALDGKQSVGTSYSKLESDLFNTVLGNGILEAKDGATLGTKEWDAYEMQGSTDTYLLDLSTDINKAILHKNSLFNVWFAPNTNLIPSADARIKIVEFNAHLLSESIYDIYIDNGTTHYRAKISDIATCATEMLIWTIVRDGDTENKVVLTLNKTGIIKEVSKIANKADKTYVDTQLATKVNIDDLDAYKLQQSARDTAQDNVINSKISGIKVVDANINNAEYTDIKEIIAGDNIRVTRTAEGVKLDAQIDVQTYATAVWGIYNSQNISLPANTVTDIPITYQNNTDPAILQTDANHNWLINNGGRVKFYDMDFQFSIPTGAATTIQWQWFVNGSNVGGLHAATVTDSGSQQFQIPAIILNLNLETANTVALKMSTSRATTIQYQNSIGIIDVIENAPDLSGGDMYTNVYDPDKDGKVTSAETADVALLANNSTQLGGLVGATAATANTVVLRDGSRRIKTNNPGSAEDAVNLSYLQGNYTTTTDTNTALNAKANSADVYTKSEADGLLGGKANSSHTHFTNQISGLSTLLAEKAPINDPTFTGSVALPDALSTSFGGVTLSGYLAGYVGVASNQTIVGIKTFTNFPVTPSSNPTSNYQVANKWYVDSQLSVKANTASPSFTGTVTIPTLTVSGVTSTNGLQVTGGNSLTMNNGWFYSKNASGTITTQFSPDGAFETQSVKVPSASAITLGSTTLATTLAGKADSTHTHTPSDISGLGTVLVNLLYPIGTIYTSTTSTNPFTLFGVGTWEEYGAGRVLVGNGTSDQTFTAGTTGGASNITLNVGQLPSHTHTWSQTSSTVDGSHSHRVMSGKNGGYMVFKSLNRRVSSNTDYITSTYSGLFSYNGDTSDGTGGSTVYTESSSNHSHTIVGSNTSTGSGASHGNLQPYVVVYMWRRTA